MALSLFACAADKANTKVGDATEPAPEGAQPSGGTDTARSDAGVTGEGRFVWKAPLAVRVEEDATRRGVDARLAYWLDVCPAGDGLLSVSHRDFRFLSLGGVAATDATLAPTLKKIAPLTSAIPQFIVDRQGRFVRVEGLEDLLSRMALVFPSSEISQLRTALEDPAVYDLVVQSVALRWRAWIELWLDFRPDAGQQQALESTSVNNRPVSRVMTVDEVVSPHRVRLSMVTQVDPDDLGRAMVALGLSGASGEYHTEGELRVSADTEWADIRPWVVTTRKRMTITGPGGAHEALEVHTYKFDWNSSAQAQPPCAR